MVTINAVVAINPPGDSSSLGDFSLVAVRDCAREDAISCKDSQLLTPSVPAATGRSRSTPGAIIPPVLKLLQATWRQSSRSWLRRRSPVYFQE